MICPECKGTIAYAERTKVSESFDMKSLDIDDALEEVGNQGFVSGSSTVFICNECHNLMEEEG